MQSSSIYADVTVWISGEYLQVDSLYHREYSTVAHSTGIKSKL